MFAPPWGIVRVALNFGWLPLWVPPKSRKASLGLKERSEQLLTWNGEAAPKSAPPVPETKPLTDIGLQLVGLIVVWGRSIRNRTSLTRRITPCRIVGNGSETALTWVESGFT